MQYIIFVLSYMSKKRPVLLSSILSISFHLKSHTQVKTIYGGLNSVDMSGSAGTASPRTEVLDVSRAFDITDTQNVLSNNKKSGLKLQASNSFFTNREGERRGGKMVKERKRARARDRRDRDETEADTQRQRQRDRNREIDRQ